LNPQSFGDRIGGLLRSSLWQSICDAAPDPGLLTDGRLHPAHLGQTTAGYCWAGQHNVYISSHFNFREATCDAFVGEECATVVIEASEVADLFWIMINTVESIGPIRACTHQDSELRPRGVFEFNTPVAATAFALRYSDYAVR